MGKLKLASAVVKNIIGLVENETTNKDYRYLKIKKNCNNNNDNNNNRCYRRKKTKYINNWQPLGMN